MNNSKPQFYFLLTLLFLAFGLVFLILRPFFYTLILAVVFSIVFRPIYRKMCNFFGERNSLASFATVIAVSLVIFIPVAFLGVQSFQEAQQLYFSLTAEGGESTILSITDKLMGNLQKQFPKLNDIPLNTDEYLKQSLNWFIQHLDSVFSSFARLILNGLIFLLAFYYLLKDGHKLKTAVVALSPLADINDEMVYSKLMLAVNSVVKGNLIIAIIQGALTSVGFAIFGVPNALLWGSVAAVAALIPSIGTALVLAPAVLFLYI